MAWQGYRNVSSFHERGNLSLFLFFAFLFLHVVDCWSACELKYDYSVRFATTVGCKNSTTSCNTDLVYSTGCDVGCSSVTIGSRGNKSCVPRNITGVLCDVFGNGIATDVARLYYDQCDTPCEADSIRCINEGMTWVSAASGELCGHCTNESMCADLKAQCEAANGVFSGSANSGCCIATCNQCGKLSDLIEQKAQICCTRGQAPPDTSRQCRVEARSTCGMNWSTILSNDNEFACRDPSGSADASAAYASCFQSSSSGGGSSSSGGGSSSSSGGGGSSGFLGECQECPYLDSILDTLTAQKGIVSNIYRCVSVPSLCSDPSYNKTFQFDTVWNRYLKPYFDSWKDLDSQQIGVLKRLDTNQLKLLQSNIELLRNDTLMRLAVSGGFSQTQDAISQTRGSIVHLNDTTRKWLDRISSKIGMATDSLIFHIDSVRKEIPVHVLDSIFKYQKQLAEKEDSIVLGDLPSIDSLIDSTVRYWRMSIENDSVRRLESNDSLYALHDAIDAVALRMSYLLGYGDTASSDLRKDLFSMNDTVKAHFDSIVARLGISTDSLIAHIDGLNELSMDSLRADLNSFSEGFRIYRDSALKYFGLFGDSMSAINGTLGELLAKFSSGVVDTNGLGVWASYVRSGENMGDSIVRSYGWQNLKNLNVDSNYSAALAGFSNKTDSVSAVVDDSLSNRAARLNDSLVRKNDSLKRSLPDTLTKYADSLVIWAPFADFDSIIYSTIGTRIPNRDDCPEDCQSWSVSIPVVGLLNYTVDYGLCLGRASLGNLSVLAFLKLLIRIIVAITCVMIIYRTLVAIK